MAKQVPKQSPTTRLGDTPAFASAVREYLAKDNLTQKTLAVKSGLSEAMVSRMLKNQNGRGDTFDLTERMVYKVALGLNLGKQGYLALMQIAFPEMFEALGSGQPYTYLVDTLNDKGKPPP